MKPQQIVNFGYSQKKENSCNFLLSDMSACQTDADAAQCWKSKYTFVYFGAECYGKTSDSGKVAPETTWSCQFLNQQLAVYDGNTFTHETTRNQIVISTTSTSTNSSVFAGTRFFATHCDAMTLPSWGKSVVLTQYHDMFLPVRF